MNTMNLDWLGTSGFQLLSIALVSSTVVFGSAVLILRACKSTSASFKNLIWRSCLALAISLPVAILCLPKMGLGIQIQGVTVADNLTPDDLPSPGGSVIDWHSLANHVLSSASISGTEKGSLPTADVATNSKAVNFLTSSAETKRQSPFAVPDWRAAIVVLWLLLAIMKLSQIVRALALTGRWKLRSRPFEHSEVSDRLVRLSDDIELPMTVGIARPIILLPAAAVHWSQQRLDLVLNHEYSHITRGDVFWNVLAAGIKAILWWQPFSWLAHRRLLMTSELACDNLVLGTGVTPVEYAQELFSIATQYRASKKQVWLPAASAAEPPIQQRIESILDSNLDRHAATCWNKTWVWSGVFAVVMLAGVIRPFSEYTWAVQSAPGTAAKQNQSADDNRRLAPGQELLQVQVLVIGADNEPVPNATINPWAVKSSLGHGSWGKKRTGGYEPIMVKTGQDGKATVEFPKYVHLEERVRAIEVTISIDSLDHPYVTHEYIKIPSDSTHKVQLPAGAAINVEVFSKDQTIDYDNLFIRDSDYRPSPDDYRSKVDKDNRVRIPPLVSGSSAQMLAVVLNDEGKATHFSRIVDFKVDGSKSEINKRVELTPATVIEGVLGPEVPRPVKNGRVKVSTVQGVLHKEVEWYDWAEVQEDGTFSLVWPRDTPIQITAMCDGFIAKNGLSLDELKKKDENGLLGQLMKTADRIRGVVDPPAKSRYLLPQLFLKPDSEPVSIAMTPLQTVYIEVENAFGKKLEGVEVRTNPNVNWSQNPRRSSSQIYCWPLSSSSEYLHDPKCVAKREGIHGFPFSSKSNSQGQIEIDLPAGITSLSFGHDRFELSAKLGRRSRRITIVSEEEQHLNFVLQPKGLDCLGDWEDLCGMVFG